MEVIINSNTGEFVDIADWVARFDELWCAGKSSLHQFMELLGPDVRLVAPGTRSTTGRNAALETFEKTFEVFPDLTGKVTRWASAESFLFIEMTFSATIGSKTVKWHNVDRFIFKNGLAIERVAFFDPSTINQAFLSSPSG